MDFLVVSFTKTKAAKAKHKKTWPSAGICCPHQPLRPCPTLEHRNGSNGQMWTHTSVGMHQRNAANCQAESTPLETVNRTLCIYHTLAACETNTRRLNISWALLPIILVPALPKPGTKNQKQLLYKGSQLIAFDFMGSLPSRKDLARVKS